MRNKADQFTGSADINTNSIRLCECVIIRNALSR